MWDTIYNVYAIVTILIMFCCVKSFLKSNTKQRLNFVTNAQKNNCVTVGKLTCLTLHGYKNPEHYEAEYMYVVDNKRYFVTYQMCAKLPTVDSKDATNADMMLLKLKPAMILFYDQKNPARVMSKLEVFTSREGIHQIKTPKENVWRDVHRDWTDAIDLVHY